jgi:hypothetical protein
MTSPRNGPSFARSDYFATDELDDDGTETQMDFHPPPDHHSCASFSQSENQRLGLQSTNVTSESFNDCSMVFSGTNKTLIY